MPFAIFQNGDEPQIISTAVMMKAAGYDLMYCGPHLRDQLKQAGCDSLYSVEHMSRLGYDNVDPAIKEATPDDMAKCDMFLEIKVRNVEPIVNRWPRLKGRIAYVRVNGSQPEICPKGGDEVNLPCPIITACLWYGTPRYRDGKMVQAQAVQEHEASRPVTMEQLLSDARSIKYGDTGGMAYVMWPPYPRSFDYDVIDRRKTTPPYTNPFCICHSARAWGYGGILSECVDLGIRFHGNNSPAGQVSHSQVPGICATGIALVHPKSVDCPGWALYEALLAGVPVVTGRLLNSRMLAYDLLDHEVTCYEFGVPATLEYGRGDPDLPGCLRDIKHALERLSDPEENRRIGEAGRKRLNELMWRSDRDGHSFRCFMARHFG